METPTPVPPTATAPEMATTEASIVAVSIASRTTSPSLSTTLSSMYAFVVVRMTFWAAAPAPLTETPTAPPEIATEAAEVSEEMVALSIASTRMSPPPVVPTSSSALAMKAATSLSISLCARPTPIDTATPVAPNAAAIEAAPVAAWMVDMSCAASVMLPAWMPVSPSPSMKARTLAAMVFIAPAPAPLTLTPTDPPDTAAEPAKTMALMDWSEVACAVSAPSATILESST